MTTDGLPAAITYDQNGNLADDSANSFTYDAENKLLAAAMGGGTNVAYEYDPLGRRVEKDVDGTITEYVHDGTHVIAEYGGSGTLLRRYVHGPGTDRPIAMVEGDAGSGYSHSYYHADRLGSVVALTDDTGAPVAHYTYDAYGIPYLVDPATGAQTQVAAGQPYLFTGRRFDFETGLYYYRARYYSASLGRFLQTDPIGTQDQMNLYAYVGNDPVNRLDPSGLKCVSKEQGTVTCSRSIKREGATRIRDTFKITVKTDLPESMVDPLMNTLPDGVFKSYGTPDGSGKGDFSSYDRKVGQVRTVGYDKNGNRKITIDRNPDVADGYFPAREEVRIGHQIGSAILGHGYPVAFDPEGSGYGRHVMGTATISKHAVYRSFEQIIATSVHEQLHAQMPCRSYCHYPTNHQEVYNETWNLLTPLGFNDFHNMCIIGSKVPCAGRPRD